jgi:hypothetical protein
MAAVKRLPINPAFGALWLASAGELSSALWFLSSCIEQAAQDQSAADYEVRPYDERGHCHASKTRIDVDQIHVEAVPLRFGKAERAGEYAVREEQEPQGKQNPFQHRDPQEPIELH